MPASCTRETFEGLGFTDATANIETCLTDYKLGDYEFGGETVNDFVPLFTEEADANGEYDVEDNPRFAIVPQTHEETLPRGREVVTIAGFKAVWVQGLYYPNGGTPVIMEPGQPETSVSVPNGGSPWTRSPVGCFPTLPSSPSLDSPTRPVAKSAVPT